jgi:hypothetical protein
MMGGAVSFLATVKIAKDMTPTAHVFVGLGALAAIAFIVRLVRHKNLSPKYSLLWVTVGLLIGIVAAWPGLLSWVSEEVGVYYPATTALLLVVGFLLLVVVHFSWELSRLERRTRMLAEELALLRAGALERDDSVPEGQDPTSAGESGA